MDVGNCDITKYTQVLILTLLSHQVWYALPLINYKKHIYTICKLYLKHLHIDINCE